VTDILRGSLVERYVTCGNPPVNVLAASGMARSGIRRSLWGAGTTGGIIPEEKVAEVRGWIGNYHKLKDHLEKISEINRE